MPTGTTAAARPAQTRRLLVALLAVLVVVAATAYRIYSRRTPAPVDPPDAPASPFRNTSPAVAYVGSAECVRCHDAHADSFHRTGMGRSMALVDLKREPPDASFDHPTSKHRYQVVRKDGQLFHRELLLTDGPDEVLLSEFPVKYVVGSGRHSLTYLVEADGFLVESPVTWYRAKNAWAMSPGYDRATQQGFERAVGESCLVCHAGRADAVGGSLHRMDVKEAAIGCERCHGPGALHVEHHRANKPVSGSFDDTIVNPAHLSRDLAEAVCSQCHLRSSASVLARGRSFADFRPGLPLQDYRLDYRLDVPDKAMSVVGHVEQMHLSRCYQKSKTFSCMTCHDPHDEPASDHSEAHYRGACLKCHSLQQCKVDPAVRQKHSPSNNCVRCHMPTSATEIPHLAFTHHRVGIHAAGKRAKVTDEQPAVLATLTPLLDLSRLSQAQQRRSLGLGYLEVANMSRDAGLAEQYRLRAIGLLEQAQSEGPTDGAIASNLARARFDAGLAEVGSLAQSALAANDLDPQDRWNAIFLLADSLAAEGRHEEAIPLLKQLAKLRRHSVPLLLLADCQRKTGGGAYVETLQEAVRINPRLWKIQQHLADHYRRAGDKAKADYHRKRAVP